MPVGLGEDWEAEEGGASEPGAALDGAMDTWVGSGPVLEVSLHEPSGSTNAN